MRLKSLKDVRRFTAKILQEVYAGGLKPDIARCLFYGLATLASIVKDGDIEMRMIEIEKFKEQMIEEKNKHDIP